jgi:hypothetical protein
MICRLDRGVPKCNLPGAMRLHLTNRDDDEGSTPRPEPRLPLYHKYFERRGGWVQRGAGRMPSAQSIEALNSTSAHGGGTAAPAGAGHAIDDDDDDVDP